MQYFTFTIPTPTTPYRNRALNVACGQQDSTDRSHYLSYNHNNMHANTIHSRHVTVTILIDRLNEAIGFKRFLHDFWMSLRTVYVFFHLFFVYILQCYTLCNSVFTFFVMVIHMCFGKSHVSTMGGGVVNT